MSNKIDKIDKFLYAIFFFWIGGAFASLFTHLRFNDDILRREMLLMMRDSNSGYFLAFFIIAFFMACIISFALVWRYKVIKDEKRIEENEVLKLI